MAPQGYNMCVLLVLFIPNILQTSDAESSIVLMYRNICRNACGDTPGTPNEEPVLNATRNGTCGPCEPCSCEDHCHMFGTCCPDFQNQTEIYRTQCMDITFILSSNQEVQIRTHVVTGCPTANNVYKEACRTGTFNNRYDPRLTTAETESGLDIIFYNIYCAMCNGFNTPSVLQPELHCISGYKPPSLPNTKALYQWAASASECDFVHRSSKPSLNVHECSAVSEDLIPECNTTSLWTSYDPDIEAACHLYYSPLTEYFSPRYKNMFCYLCNGGDIGGLEKGHACSRNVLRMTPFRSISFVALLNFLPSISSTYRDSPRMISTCDVSSVYDPLENVCKPVVCPDFAMLVDDSCEFQFLVLGRVSFHINVLFLPNTTVSTNTDSMPDLTHRIFGKLYSHILLKLTEANMTLNGMTTLLRPVHHRSNGYFEVESVLVDFYAKPAEIISIDACEEILLRDEMYQLDLAYEDSVIDFQYSVIYGGDELDVSDGQYSSFWGVEMNSNDEGNEFFIQLNPSSSCPLVEYEQKTFRILSNWQIQHTSTNITLNRTQYMVNNSKILLCSWYMKALLSVGPASHQTSFKGQTQDSDGSATATTVVQFIGLICLFLTFLTYTLFPELRTLPGKNLMFLVLSLFVAHLSFMAGAHVVNEPKVCSIVGIIIHFSWLSSFAWMAVCTFHVYKTFKTVTPNAHVHADTNCLYRHCAFAFGIPFIIVFLVCVISLGLSHGEDVGYGPDEYQLVCFVPSVLVSAITFGLPITINIFHNVLFLVITCISLRKASKLRRSLHRGDLSVLSHCCKLSTLTGVSWVVGFASILTQLTIFVYLFVLLSAGQGVFMFFAFVTTKRVFRLYRNLFKRICLCSRESGNNR